MADDLRAGLLTKEEYLEGASLSYSPVVLALPKKRFHELTLDRVIYKTIDVEQDSIVAEILTKEATEKKHIKASSGKFEFNVFAKGAKFIQSLRNGVSALPKLHSDVLRAYSILFDKDGLLGDGENNGLIVSSNPKYVTNANVQIPASTGTGFNRVQALKKLGTNLKTQVNKLTASTDLIIYYYGQALIEFLGDITEGTNADLMTLFESSFKGKNVTWIEIPELALDASHGSGFVVVSADVAVLDMTTEPTIENDGTNDEDNYYFANYITGSLQVTPEVEGAIIKQPVTFAS